jgi:hypothetical protein
MKYAIFGLFFAVAAAFGQTNATSSAYLVSEGWTLHGDWQTTQVTGAFVAQSDGSRAEFSCKDCRQISVLHKGAMTLEYSTDQGQNWIFSPTLAIHDTEPGEDLAFLPLGYTLELRVRVTAAAKTSLYRATVD